MALRSALPANRYTQAELTRMFTELTGLPMGQRALLERLHGNAGVDARHIALPIAEYDGLRGVPRANERYIEEATGLAERALRAALDTAGLPARDLDLLIVTSVTGVVVPSIERAAHPAPRAAAGHQAAAHLRAGLRRRRGRPGTAARLPARLAGAHRRARVGRALLAVLPRRGHYDGGHGGQRAVR